MRLEESSKRNEIFVEKLPEIESKFQKFMNQIKRDKNYAIAFQSKNLVYEYTKNDGSKSYYNLNPNSIANFEKYFGEDIYITSGTGYTTASDDGSVLESIAGIKPNGNLIVVKGKNKGGFINFLTSDLSDNFEKYGIYTNFNIINYEKNCLV